MMSSAAFPKVALSSPPMPSPIFSARCSVAFPINPASGMMAMQEVTNTATGLAPQWSSAAATGTNTSSKFSAFSKESSLTFVPLIGGE